MVTLWLGMQVCHGVHVSLRENWWLGMQVDDALLMIQPLGN